MSLNQLPTIITGPGDYKLRNGLSCTVHELVYPPEYSEEWCKTTHSTAFPAKGTVWAVKPLKLRPRYDAWHVSGRLYPLEESQLDIVSKLEGE